MSLNDVKQSVESLDGPMQVTSETEPGYILKRGDTSNLNLCDNGSDNVSSSIINSQIGKITNGT